MASVSVQLERDGALTDAQAIINEYGEDIILYYRGEPEISRDRYNSIIHKEVASDIEIELKSYPITFNPNKKMLEKCGLTENCDIMCKVAMKDLTDNDLTFEGLDLLRCSIVVRNNKYELKDKQLDSQFADTYLYVHIGATLV